MAFKDSVAVPLGQALFPGIQTESIINYLFIRIPRQRRILLKTAPELHISNNLVPSREHVLLVLRLFSNESLAVEKHGSHKELWF